ncbi:unnamed protein product [Gordionus sp. m RMFG-2023]
MKTSMIILGMFVAVYCYDINSAVPGDDTKYDQDKYDEEDREQGAVTASQYENDSGKEQRSNLGEENIRWELSGNCMGFEIPFQRKKCKSDNKFDCSFQTDRFFKCKKTGPEISSKSANDIRCNEIAKKLSDKGLYAYVKDEYSCQLKCKTGNEKPLYPKGEFVLDGTVLSNKTLCIDRRVHESSSDDDEIVSIESFEMH